MQSIDIWEDPNFGNFNSHGRKNSHIKHKRLDVHDMSFETVGTFDIVFRAGDSTTYGIH